MKDYNFAGWVTKNDIKCSDGVIIKHDAFRDNDGQKVPLVWNHDYNNPENVLGHVVLQHNDKGVYGYGYFNDTISGQNAKKQVQHGDLSSMSIGARKIKRQGSDIVHGLIYEVSLVLAGANPGALIETVLNHGVDGEEAAIIHTGNLIHSDDDILEPKEIKHNSEKTLEEVIETMNAEQKDALYSILALVTEEEEEEEEEEKEEKEEKKDDDQTPKEEGKEMKHNVFNKTQNEDTTLKHSVNEVLMQAMSGKASSLKEVLQGLTAGDDAVLKHGINSIEMLFPEAFQSTNGNTPILYKDPNTGYKEILNATTKSPFSRVRTLVADLTEEEARAKGYIKGTMKKEQFFSLIRRSTTPTTIYKKQKLDRDDIVDITDFDVVSFINMEMRMMLEEELARAILVGDGRAIDNADKIDETHIRPVISDNDFFTIKKNFATAAAFIEAVILAMAEYRGSGLPTMYIEPTLLASVKLLKAQDGRYLFGDIPSDAAVATRLGMKNIVPTTFMIGKGALVVNLSDYTVGATKGGQITNFDDFDIDFNQFKYLIETRLSGALTLPKSAIHFNQGNAAGTGATDANAGLTYGERQTDKPDPGEDE